jgi:hypothetical protein
MYGCALTDKRNRCCSTKSRSFNIQYNGLNQFYANFIFSRIAVPNSSRPNSVLSLCVQYDTRSRYLGDGCTVQKPPVRPTLSSRVAP